MVTKTAPPAVQNPRYRIVPFAVATVLTGMAIAQLVNFEAVVSNIASYGLMRQEAAVAQAILIIAFEIFAIPFLIRLWLSPLARITSAICAVLAPTVWLALLLSAFSQGHEVAKTGIVGDFIDIPLSPLLLLGFVILTGASLWSFRLLGGETMLKKKRTA